MMKPILINDLALLKYGHEKIGGFGEPIGDEFPKDCVSFGQYKEDGEPFWVVALHSFKYGHDCLMDVTLNIKGMMSPSLFRMMARVVFDYIFNQAKLARVSVQVRLSNKASIRIARAWGMKDEGMKRLGFKLPSPEDMLLLGMIKTECPWI